jgi:hypothetical protein
VPPVTCQATQRHTATNRSKRLSFILSLTRTQVTTFAHTRTMATAKRAPCKTFTPGTGNKVLCGVLPILGLALVAPSSLTASNMFFLQELVCQLCTYRKDVHVIIPGLDYDPLAVLLCCFPTALALTGLQAKGVHVREWTERVQKERPPPVVQPQQVEVVVVKKTPVPKPAAAPAVALPNCAVFLTPFRSLNLRNLLKSALSATRGSLASLWR